jgi:hypothetical protein
VTTTFSLRYSTNKFSWGYYALIALLLALIGSTVAYFFFLRQKVHDYDVVPLLG